MRIRAEMEEQALQLTKFDGTIFLAMFHKGLEVLEENRSAIDVLNVFPVPDGDTGTNMVLTMRSAVKEMGKVGITSLSDLAQAASMGSLMGARGNSGVILSQLIRGIAKGLEDKEEASALDFAEAMQIGVKTAYKAVMKPVEGTILTVSREAAQGAFTVAKETNSVVTVLNAMLASGEEALIHTPDLLPVLKKAGVVDAGGKGFIFILSGFQQALVALEEGRESELAGLGLPLTAVEVPEFPVHKKKDSAVDTEIEFCYCTEVILKGKEMSREDLKLELARFGDSLLVVGEAQLIKIHVHTNHPGAVLETCLKYGSLLEVKVDNMQEQAEAHTESPALFAASVPAENEVNAQEKNPSLFTENNAEQSLLDQTLIEANVITKKIGLVAVSVGDGIRDILLSLGVDEIVVGGQTMNPSIEDLVQAVNQISVDQVLILPNNSNIILAAQQVIGLTEKEVRVVPTRNIAQAVTALVAFDPEASLEKNYQNMLQASQEVKSGEVTFAVRDSQIDNLEIKANQIIGLSGNKIQVVGIDKNQVVEELLGKIVDEEDELISLFYGEEVTSEEAEGLAADLQGKFPDHVIELYAGGQPLYSYIISVE